MRPCCTRAAWRNVRTYSSKATSKNSELPGTPRYRIRHMGGSLKRMLGQIKKEGQDDLNKMREQEKERQRQSAANLQRVYRPLPLSPLMDPVKIAARQRYREAKTVQGEETLTPFQIKLAANPYAQALSTPVRRCIYTGVRMPVFFQIQFHAVKHPKTGAPWFVPAEHVLQDPPSKPTTKTTQEDDSYEDESEELEAHPQPETKEGEMSSPAQPKLRPRPNGAGAYMLARQSLLHNLSQKSLTYHGEIMRIIPPRWKQYTHLRHEDTVWREDMATYYLDILRKTVLGKLKYLRHRNAGYLATTAQGLDGIPKMMNLGAVLWLGNPSRHSDPGSSAVEQEPSSSFPPEGPKPYLMVKYKNHHIPVYNMRTMLGDELLQSLRESDQLFDREFVMLKAKANTVKTRMLLWKLQIYTAYFQDEDADAVGMMGPASKQRRTLGKRKGTQHADGANLLGMETAA